MNTQPFKLQGRDITADDIQLIESLITINSDWHRSRLLSLCSGVLQKDSCECGITRNFRAYRLY